VRRAFSSGECRIGSLNLGRTRSRSNSRRRSSGSPLAHDSDRIKKMGAQPGLELAAGTSASGKS
jgi:hypothetical protein